MSAILLNDVDIYYGEKKAVRSASIDISEGESFALVGESGSGKSTVLKAIMGLAPNWTGQLSVLGKQRHHRLDKEFARQCQMVFQDPFGSLHPRKTIDSVLMEPLVIHKIKSPSKRVEDALTDVGLGKQFRYRFPHQLSGGQRQRVAIARALILEPKIVLLDEPTSALDVSVQAEVLNLLKRLKKERNLTYILVTHNLPLVSFMCDRMAIMNKGQIVETCVSSTLHDGSFRHSYSRHLYQASGGNIQSQIN